MIIASYSQTTTEVKNYKLDYSAWLDSGVTITGVATSIDTVTVPPLVAVGTLTSGNTFVTLSISGGVLDTDYIVEVTSTTSDGQTKQDCIEFILEPACQ